MQDVLLYLEMGNWPSELQSCLQLSMTPEFQQLDDAGAEDGVRAEDVCFVIILRMRGESVMVLVGRHYLCSRKFETTDTYRMPETEALNFLIEGNSDGS